MFLLLPALLLPATMASPQPNQRTLQYLSYPEQTLAEQRTLTNPIPQGVNVGALELLGARFIYTYVNQTSILATGAAVLGGLVLIAVGLYFYDLFIGGGSRREDENIHSTNFDYYDPYGYNAAAAYDPTTRIKR